MGKCVYLTVFKPCDYHMVPFTKYPFIHSVVVFSYKHVPFAEPEPKMVEIYHNDGFWDRGYEGGFNDAVALP
jgi:hypothetical protein